MDKNLFLKIVFVFIIILIIAGSGFAGFKILKDINEIEKQVDQALITKLPLTPKDKPESPPEDFDSSEIDTSDWQTYRNEEYGFEVKYPKGWFVIEEDKDYTKEKIIRFSNYQSSFQEAGAPNDFLSSYIMIFSKENSKAFENFQKMETQYKSVTNDKIGYDIKNNQKIRLYIISKRTLEKDNLSWDVVLPYAKAFSEDNSYGYIFYYASPIPSGTKGQQRELEILKESIKSFKN